MEHICSYKHSIKHLKMGVGIGERQMTEQQKNLIVQLMNMIFIITGLIIVFSMRLSFYYLLAVLFGSIAISKIIGFLLPVQNNNKSKSSKKTKPIQTNSTSKKKTQTSITGNPYNVKPIEQLLTFDLKDLSGYDFEELCFQYFKSTYKQVEQTPYAKDRGVDFVFIDEEGFRTAVQIKHKMESGKYVTNKEIHELTGAKRNYKCMRAMFITSTGYTQDARYTAAEHGMRIEAYHWVENKILRWREKEAKKRKLAW